MAARLLTIPVLNAIPARDPDQDPEHLRRLLEVQPSCLMRVAVDGELLAANQAALALLGAQELSDVVGHSLTQRLAPNHGTEWSNFADRVWHGAPGSFECDVTTIPGDSKSVLFQAVPLPGHPDEIRSLLLTARDVSANRRLETALEQRDAIAAVPDLRGELDAMRAERARAEASLAEQDGNQQRLAAEHAAEVARLTQTLTEHHQLTTLLTSRSDAARVEQQQTAALLEQREAEHARELDAVQAQLAGALAETLALKTSLERRGTESQQLVTEHEVERARLQQTAAAERERAQDFEQQVKQLADERTELEAALNASVADTADLKALLQQHQNAVTDLRNKLVNAAVERKRLTTLVDQRDADVVKALADQKLDLKILTENMRNVEPLAAAGRLAIEVHGELQAFLAQIEERAGRLIERCALEAVDRHEIEQLRIDTVRAASLARQVVAPNGETP